MNRSYECSEEAVKELDEARIVYSLRSALNKQKAFDGLRACPGPDPGANGECRLLPFTGCWIFPFVVSPSTEFILSEAEGLRRALSNHRPPPEHDAIYATNFRVGTIESGLAMTGESR